MLPHRLPSFSLRPAPILLALAAVLVAVTVGPLLTVLLAAAGLVTWLSAYTSAGLGS